MEYKSNNYAHLFGMSGFSRQFGSFSAWETDFRATGALRGIGWAIVYRDTTGALINMWIDQHDCGHLTGCSPILVLDVFEHAFLLDYGLERGKYIEAFMKNVDWEIASERYDTAKQTKSVVARVS